MAAMSPILGLFLLPFALALSIGSVALVRRAAATGLGMRGVRLPFSGSIENAEAAVGWRQATVAVAGVAASYLVSAVVFSVVFLVNGETVSTTAVEVIPGSPAEAAGLATGDRVASVAGTPIATWEDISSAVSRHPEEPIEVVVDRGGEEKRFTVTPARTPGKKGRIGIRSVQKPLGVVATLGRGLVAPVVLLADMGRGLWSYVVGDVEREPVSGPAGIVREAQGMRPAGVFVFFGILLAFVWPASAIVALATVPRRALRKR
jgi:regulator of sigma E protease